MKKMLCVLAVVGILLCSGCSSEGNRVVTDGRFQKVEDSLYDGEIYVDTETKVMYWSLGYGLTVLLDAEGKPLLWEGELR